MEIGSLPLAAWESFYVIVGSSAAALTGLQFVVIVLGAEAEVVSGATMRAFGTPTIVHFCAALLISAILSAPWSAVAPAAVCLLACGAAGLGYLAGVFRHARKQSGYTPVFEDWLWHFVFPAGAYVALLVAALDLRGGAPAALFVIAGSAMFLLFIGIHNAWDAVTYIALKRKRGKSDQ
ncbi:MAG TPA: hypothetical protein VGR67_05560 [Candidatus Polarisedimenticolia bacterium]|jgi:hypothetical protein|nr:hypothetical protein [Candidatus Polarisedimenticolia bacterium]